MTQENQNFITEYLRHRSQYTAYCLAYNPQNAADFESIMRSAGRLMDDPEVGGLINTVLSSVRHEVEQQLRAELKTDLLTIQSKRELLARIARGEAYAVQNYKGKDCNVCTQHVWPTINQMLRAIDLDNRMAGHYPIKESTVDNSQLTNEQNVPNAQQLSEALSLRPLKESSLPQQNATTVASSHTAPADNPPKEQNPLPGRGLGEAPSRSSENTPNPQQNTTNQEQAPLLFLGGGNCEQRLAVSNSGEVNTRSTEVRT